MEDQSRVGYYLRCRRGRPTLAIDLARRGASLRIVEKMERPFSGSRGKGIQPRTQEVFEDIGIIDKIVAAGGLYPAQREYRDDGSYTELNIIELRDPTPAEPYFIPLMIRSSSPRGSCGSAWPNSASR